MKKKLVFFIFFWHCTGLFGQIFFPADFKLDSKVVIVFDVDGVLVNRDLSLAQLKKFLHVFKETPRKWDLIKVVWWQYRNKKLIAKLVDKFNDEEAIKYMAEVHPVMQTYLKSGKTIKEHCIEIKSTGLCFEDTRKILTCLYDQGYQIGVATNQSLKTFNNLVTGGYLPSLNYFSYICTSNSVAPKNINNGFIKKPDQRYFEYLSQMVCQKCNTENVTIVFIDDSIENVIAASKKGFIGVHFSSAKNLQKDLQILNIYV